MPTAYARPTLVLNIKREFFAAILSIPQRKTIEYRSMSKFWLSRLERVGAAPFDMRMLNGMTPPVPEATVRITKVVKRSSTRTVELHIGRILRTKHWNRKLERPR